MPHAHPRPLSPHLTIWKWGPHMLVSILHRITGSGLTVVGLGLLALWLGALAEGEASYDRFRAVAGHPLALAVLVGLSWAFFQHLFSGLRHLLLDTGAGYELKTNKFWSVMVVLGALTATAAFWLVMLGVGR